MVLCIPFLICKYYKITKRIINFNLPWSISTCWKLTFSIGLRKTKVPYTMCVWDNERLSRGRDLICFLMIYSIFRTTMGVGLQLSRMPTLSWKYSRLKFNQNMKSVAGIPFIRQWFLLLTQSYTKVRIPMTRYVSHLLHN